VSVDGKTLNALKDALTALESEPASPIQPGLIAPLSEIARPGNRVKLDLAASETLGAPLVSVWQTEALDLSSLTPRQREVAQLIAKGLPNKTIASRLGISLATVKDHVHAILARLGLPSRAALIAKSPASERD